MDNQQPAEVVKRKAFGLRIQPTLIAPIIQLCDQYKMSQNQTLCKIIESAIEALESSPGGLKKALLDLKADDVRMTLVPK